MSKRRKLIINNMEVTIQNESDDTSILEYIECGDSYIVDGEQFVNSEQFTIANEDGTIVQYIEPSEYEATYEQEIDENLEQENNVTTVIQEPMEYTTVKGQRENLIFLYCNRQLYKKNRSKYYRCRLFPNCTGSGRIIDNLFHLLQPHSDHEDQEDLKNSLSLYHSLKGKSKQTIVNFESGHEEETVRSEFLNDRSTKDKLLATKVLRRNRDAFRILKELLGDGDNYNPNDQRELNNFNQTESIPIEGLGIRTKIISSAGHIYLHTGTSTYRCYMYPKCLAMGFYFNGQGVSYFQLVREHAKHGFKDNEKDILTFITVVKKRVQLNPNNFKYIFEEELSRDCYAHIRHRLSYDDVLKLFIRLGTLGTVDDPTALKDKIETPVKVPRPYVILEGGPGSHVLFCDNQLYNNNNRSGYYRCRLYQQGCPATGQRVNSTFTLTRPHVGHWSQLVEKNKLMFISSLRRRAATELLPLEIIYQQEIRNPDFKSVSAMVPYTSVYKTMKRARMFGLVETSKECESEQNIAVQESESDIETNTEQTETVDNSQSKTDNAKVNYEVVDVDSIEWSVTNKVKNPSLPCMEYTLMEGERLGSCILYCNEQLYTLNRNNYYRCRMYPQGCQATGMREGNLFRLCRGHAGHGSQEPERRRIILINSIKKQTMTNPDSDYFEYADIVERVSFTVILNNMRKIWKRYQQQDPTLTRNIMRNDLPEDLHQKMSEREAKVKPDSNIEIEDLDDVRMAVEVGDDIQCDQDTSASEYSLMEGERLGSCILYSNQQLYTNNQRNYYRCRMYSIGCRATGIIKDSLFQLLKPHNGHGSQEREVRRLILITGIKRRAQIDPTRLQTIFNEECAKPEFADVADMVNFKKIYSTLDRCRRRAAVDVLEVVEPKIPPGISVQEFQNEQSTDDVLKTLGIVSKDSSSYLKYKEYSLMEGENSDSCYLYCNQQLYVNIHNNNYRCRLFTMGCRAVGIVKNTLFQLTKPHTGHESQEKYVRRLVLITRIKRRAQCDPSQLQQIYDEECAKPVFQDIAAELTYEEVVEILNQNYDDDVNGVQIELSEYDNDTVQRTLRVKTWDQISHESQTEMEGVEYFDNENTDNQTGGEEYTVVVTKSEATDENQEENLTQDQLISQLGLADSGDENSYENNLIDVSLNEDISTAQYTEDGENFSFIGGDRFGSKLLYSEGQLYCLNRDNYFRCRVYPNCIATGRVYGSQFRLHRGHAIHPLQDDEKTRLLLMNSLKQRVQQETTPIKTIFDEECAKPEFRDVASMVNYKTIFSTLMKRRTRSQQTSEKDGNDSETIFDHPLATNVLQEFQGNVLNESEYSEEETLTPDWDLEEWSASDTDEVLEVPKPDMKTATKYTIIQGDRTGSLILYSNGHLYTKNRGSYYRCRLHPACYGSGNRRGNLFYMTRQHVDHPLQDDEKCRLALMGVLKKRVLQESTPLKVIYDEEIVKHEFAAIADLVSFKMIQSTMIKIRERVRYGQEPGTVVLSTDAVSRIKHDDDDDEHMDTEDQHESDVDEPVVNDTKKKIKSDVSTERFIYYYILDSDYANIGDPELQLNLGEHIKRDVFKECTFESKSIENAVPQPLMVYIVDINQKFNNGTTLQRKVHVLEDYLPLECANTRTLFRQVDNPEPLKYKIIEDCLNEQYLLYAGKHIYIKKKNRNYVCRIKTCHAMGHIRNGKFCLLYGHSNHKFQNKVKLQLQLISRIRRRCLERRTARVSKVFREECTRPELRSVANTITLDGISEMVRKSRRKLFPRLIHPPSEMTNETMLSELPPPVEFSMVNGTKPEIRLLHCVDSLFYHSSKGVYRCHVSGCKSFGRRDRIFFQLLAPHTEHGTVDLNDKEKLLELIKEIEDDIAKKKLIGDTEQDDKEDNDNVVHTIKFEQDSFEDHSSQILQQNLSSEDKGTNQKSILEQAWEELQVHI